MFRQVKTDLPRQLLGWDTGTLEVVGPIHLEPTPEYKAAHGGFKTKKMQICTTDESEKLSGYLAQISEDGNVTWQPGSGSGGGSGDDSSDSSHSKGKEKVRLPVYNRYSSAVQFQIGSGGVGPIGQNADFVAICWFKDVPDDEETTVRIPVLKSGNQKQLRQNYSESICLNDRLTGLIGGFLVNEQTAQTHQYEVVGYLTATLILDSGLDPDHED